MAYHFVRGYTAGGILKHLGVDLGAPTGQPIYAVHGGIVTYAADSRVDPAAPWYSYGTNGARGSAGIIVAIDTGGVLDIYAHCSNLAVRAGQIVQAGERIGSVGATGNATGSHVHFGEIAGRTFLDPLKSMSSAQLIAAISGQAAAPASSSSVVLAGQRTTAQTIAILQSLGIPTDPAHIITATEAAKIVDQEYGLLGELRTDAIKTYTGKTVQWIMDSWVAGGSVNVTADPIKAVADAIAGIPAALVGLLWLFAILVVIILGLYVTLGSSSEG